jgi:dolichol-phosphate mannosyltransferase
MTDRPPPDPGLISLVIPVFNEQESLRPLLAEIDAAVKPLTGRCEIVFVDDGSTDASWATIRELSADPRVKGLKFRRNFGKAAALQAGFDRAAGGVVLTLDADLQDDPAEIPRFLAAVRGGTDVVSGWKKVRNDPWHKVFPSRVFNGLVSRLTGVKLHDHNCGFKAYRGQVLREVRLYGELHRFVPVLAAAEGFTVGELVINHRRRRFGHSKFGAKRFLKGFLDLLSVRFVTAFGKRPVHPLGTVAVIGAAVAAVLIVLAVGLWYVAGATFPALLAVAAAAATAVLAGQAFLTGLVAELLLDRTPIDDSYRIAESTP